MKFILLLFHYLILCFIVNIFGSPSDMFPNKQEIPEPDQLMMQIIDKTCDELESKYKMSSCGIGMSGKFKNVSIHFQIFRSLTKEKARAMLLDSVEIFLNNINSCEDIKPYLKDVPFTSKNVGIRFFIRDENGKELFHPEISVARWTSNEVYFCTQDPEKKYGYKEIYEETHEEAIELVKKYQAEQAKLITDSKE